MRREELDELHYITPIANVPSILQLGILSNRRSRRLNPPSIAKPEVQELRAKVRVPGGRPLHDYANLYICARNPMMYLRAPLHEETCVLRVSTAVLDLPHVVITDQNAASPYRRFMPSPNGLAAIDRAMVFADDWRHPGNPPAYFRHRSVKCAEVLVPDVVPREYVLSAYASGPTAQNALAQDAPHLPAVINGHIFFR
jgi:ssDNA thymidine ADP-ribosyltransferase, DarT